MGQLVGVVKYVGDLDSSHTNDPLFVGLKLDDPGIYVNFVIHYNIPHTISRCCFVLSYCCFAYDRHTVAVCECTLLIIYNCLLLY